MIAERFKLISLACLLLLTVPLWVSIGSQSGGALGPSVLAWLIIVYAGCKLLVICKGPQARPAALMFWLFAYIFFGVCALAQVQSETFPWGGSYQEATLGRVFFLLFLGMLAFDAGQRLSNVRLVSSGISRWALKPHRIVLFAPVVLALTAYSVLKIGGLGALFQSRVELEGALSSEMSSPEAAFFRHMANTPIYVLFVLALIHWRSLAVGRSRNIWLMISLLLGFVTAVVNNPISTPRFQVGSVVIGTVFALGWSRNKAFAFCAAMSLAMLVVFPVADAFRVEREVDVTGLLADAPDTAMELTKNGDYDAFQQMANAVEFVERRGHSLGAQIGGALLFWVPRSLWSTKPVPTGELVAEGIGYSYLNLSSPLWMEFYVDGGLLLVVMGMLGFGYLISRLDLHSGVQVASFGGVLSLLVAGYEFFLLRGSLMPAVAYFTPGLMVLLVCTFPGIRIKNAKAGYESVPT